MIILAIESSGAVASAAILENDKVLTEQTGPFNVTHSQTLMPMVSKAFEDVNMKPEDIDLIAVSGGPGSFTGLRIGSATAKGLGFALNKDLIHVPTLNAMALNVKASGKIIVPLMDARRSQVYTGIYEFAKADNGGENAGLQPEVLMEGCAMSITELVDVINDKYADRQVIFLGDGVGVSEQIIRETCKAEFTFAAESDNLQKASSVGLLGFALAAEGHIVKASDEAPEYLRPSQAERVRAEQNSAG